MSETTPSPPSASPRVTAIVLNWCAEEDTTACVESLLASSYDRLRVLIVDNASPDGSGERLHQRFPGLPYLQTGSNQGYAGGNNRGIERALADGCEYVLIVNDDAVVDPRCVELLVRAAQETGASAVGPQIRYFDQPDLVACGAGHFSIMRGLGVHHDYRPSDGVVEARTPVTFVSGCCVLLDAEALRRDGAFDESYFAYVEDAELSLRWTRAGRTLLYEPAARVLHRATPGAPLTAFQIRQGNRNRRRLAARHYGPAEKARFIVWFYGTRLAHTARYALRGEWSLASEMVTSAFSRL